jgi:hypothetical protein
MRKLFYLVLALGLVGCVSSDVKEKIAFQTARLDRAVALIDSGAVTQKEEEDFIRGERKVWHALNYSINGAPLPPDLQPPAGK